MSHLTPSHITRHTSHVTRHTSHVTRHTSHVTRHTSHVTRHTSQVTRHTSHVTRHLSSLSCPTSFHSPPDACHRSASHHSTHHSPLHRRHVCPRRSQPAAAISTDKRFQRLNCVRRGMTCDGWLRCGCSPHQPWPERESGGQRSTV